MGGAPRPPGAKRPKRWSGGLGTEPSASGTQDGARQTHLPVQGPLVQLISGSDPAADLGDLLPGFEGELRRQDARQLLQGGTRSRRAALTGRALGGALSSRPSGPCPPGPSDPCHLRPPRVQGCPSCSPGPGVPPGASIHMAPPGRAAVGGEASVPWLLAPPSSPAALTASRRQSLLSSSRQASSRSSRARCCFRTAWVSSFAGDTGLSGPAGDRAVCSERPVLAASPPAPARLVMHRRAHSLTPVQTAGRLPRCPVTAANRLVSRRPTAQDPSEDGPPYQPCAGGGGQGSPLPIPPSTHGR